MDEKTRSRGGEAEPGNGFSNRYVFATFPIFCFFLSFHLAIPPPLLFNNVDVPFLEPYTASLYASGRVSACLPTTTSTVLLRKKPVAKDNENDENLKCLTSGSLFISFEGYLFSPDDVKRYDHKTEKR
jgi:hypothetical protein